MRKALLALLPVLALATVSVAGCGDASSSTGIQRSRGATKAIPDPGEPQDHDPNTPDEPADAPNPNANTPPPAPATPGTVAGELGVTLSTATPATDLGTSLDLTVTVEPKAGFKGDAALSVTGLPTGATATFVPEKVTLNTTPVTSKLTIKVLASAAPSATGAASALVVKAASTGTTPVEATANANFKINPKITMTIPVNVDAMRAAVGTRYVDGWFGPMFGSAPQPLQTQAGNPITVVVKNADSVAHIVHGNAGFVHGDTNNPVPAGGTDPKNRTLAAGVNTSGYLHEGQNGTSESFRISVNTAQ
ncbi:MAG: hypothetical protein JWP87_314 [Labilithrix sp.]|nr:hypothetical protein [Labilithrix sp.]